jgi:protein phosphatase
VASLVTELRTRENGMLITDGAGPTVASRMGVGARDVQLDALLTGTHLFAVADGFGHDPRLAESALRAISSLDAATGVIDPVQLIDSAVTAAAAAIAQPESATAPDTGSGCTLTALMLGTGEAAIAHVGDSRAFLVREGRLARLTRDHTMVQSLIDAGRLTEEEARAHPDRMVLNRALLPSASALPDISLHAIRPGDRFVLTTDGVHAVLQPAGLAALLTGAGSPEEVVNRVEEEVLAAGAPDNYAVVAVDVPGDDS